MWLNVVRAPVLPLLMVAITALPAGHLVLTGWQQKCQMQDYVQMLDMLSRSPALSRDNYKYIVLLDDDARVCEGAVEAVNRGSFPSVAVGLPVSARAC